MGSQRRPRGPSTKEEFDQRYHENLRREGFDVWSPCPFCGAADFAFMPALGTLDALRREVVCRECGRGAKAVQDGDDEVLVQTSGPDQAEWMAPRIRRLF